MQNTTNHPDEGRALVRYIICEGEVYEKVFSASDGDPAGYRPVDLNVIADRLNKLEDALSTAEPSEVRLLPENAQSVLAPVNVQRVDTLTYEEDRS